MMNQADLNILLDSHEAWLAGNSQGKRCRIVGEDLSGLDLSNRNLKKIDLRRCDLSNCNFSNSDCTDGIFVGTKNTATEYNEAILNMVDFCIADISQAKLIGAIWGGRVLKKNPIQFGDNKTSYWVMLTDNFMQVSCQFHTIDEWFLFTDAQRRTFDEYDPERAVNWWANNVSYIEELVNTYKE